MTTQGRVSRCRFSIFRNENRPPHATWCRFFANWNRYENRQSSCTAYSTNPASRCRSVKQKSYREAASVDFHADFSYYFSDESRHRETRPLGLIIQSKQHITCDKYGSKSLHNAGRFVFRFSSIQYTRRLTNIPVLISMDGRFPF